jgi:hypothetical protein
MGNLIKWTVSRKRTDNTNLNTSHLPNFSGNWSNGDNAGVFYLNVNHATDNSNSNYGTHQMFQNKNAGLPCLLAKHNKLFRCIGRLLVPKVRFKKHQ